MTFKHSEMLNNKKNIMNITPTQYLDKQWI